jgi:ABC-type uncharacterized transport system substrate-binding protein
MREAVSVGGLFQFKLRVKCSPEALLNAWFSAAWGHFRPFSAGFCRRTHAVLVRTSIILHLIAVAAVWGAAFLTLALETGLPTACKWREMAEQGCLLSYNASITKLWERAVDYVDRILKGASPGEMPVEQPTHFEFVLNMKTAKTLRLDLPPLLLARADQAIE